jgi:hypothetical protein
MSKAHIIFFFLFFSVARYSFSYKVKPQLKKGWFYKKKGGLPLLSILVFKGPCPFFLGWVRQSLAPFF